MRFIWFFRGVLRRARYRLATLFALVAAISVPLAFWAEREHQYRVRLAAVATLDNGHMNVGVIPRGAAPDTLEFIDSRLRPLRRDDVIVYANCQASDEALSAIVRLPTLGALALYDVPGAWIMTDAVPGTPEAPLPLAHGKLAPGAIDPALQRIAKLPLLEELSLGGTSVSDEGLNHAAGLHSLRVLRLANTKIADSALKRLSPLRRLEELDLSRTAITDAGIRDLSALTSLRVLNLSFTNISGVGFEDLTRLCHLEDLDLASTVLSDTGARHLAQLVSLRNLDLSNTKI
ncbi:MAG: leucine-rich repeat domain-containing protein, partial [Bryobacteraceae bacterium]